MTTPGKPAGETQIVGLGGIEAFAGDDDQCLVATCRSESAGTLTVNGWPMRFCRGHLEQIQAALEQQEELKRRALLAGAESTRIPASGGRDG